MKTSRIFISAAVLSAVLHRSGNAWTRNNIILSNKTEDFRVLSFAQDATGELYVLANLGSGTSDTKGVVL